VENFCRAGHDTDDILRRMRTACWITNATDTLRVCPIYCFSTAKIIMRACLIFIHCLVLLMILAKEIISLNIKQMVIIIIIIKRQSAY
jgi:hypothetical protein